MRLTLTLTRTPNGRPDLETSKTLDRQGLAIGRGEDNDWVLPDSSKVLSRHHCRIDFRSDGYVIVDTDSTNGVFLNDAEEKLKPWAPAMLEDGDRLRLGDYEIQARLSSGAYQHAYLTNPVTEEPAVVERVSTSFPLGGNDDPFADLVAREGTGVQQSASTPNEIERLVAGLAEVSSRPLKPHAAESDHLPPERQFMPPPSSIAPEGSFRMGDTVEIDGGPPARTESTSASPEEPISNENDVPPVDADALRAFLLGARVPDLVLSKHDQTLLMEGIGKTFREMVQGLMDVLVARKGLKGMIGAEQTTLQAENNNPLKFSSSVDQAIVRLLTSSEAYLKPTDAVRQGFDDIKAHEVAVIAGTQAMFSHILRRFEPKSLQSRLDGHSLLDGMIPSKRKAKYWDVFNTIYEEIAAEIEDDFRRSFAREFRRAYEEHLRKLQ